MAKNYPIEVLLRPPVEWWSAATSLSVGTLAATLPSMFLATPYFGFGTATLLCLFGLHRFCQGYKVVRYQHNLKKLPFYSVSADEISISHKKLFLGKGFHWQPIHTQRLRDCQRIGAEKYLKPGRLYQLARKAEIKWENNKHLSFIAKKLASDSRFNPVRPLPPVGGNPIIHGVEPNEQEIWMNLSERVGHTIVLGTTRVGKTRLLELLATQDIRRGDVVIVFDPKGDGDLLRTIYAEAKACGREDDLLMFHLGFPESSARYNPIGSFARITEVANRVANQLPSSGESAAFKEFAWRFVNIIAKALVALGRKTDYQQIQRYILNIDGLLLDYCSQWLPTVNPNWEQEVETLVGEIKTNNLAQHMRSRSRKLIAIVDYIARNDYYDPIANGLCSAFNYDKTYFDKITASLLPLIEKLTTGRTASLIAPDYFDIDDKRPIFDWMQVIKGKKIVYVGLDALSDSTVASAVGSSMFSDLCSVAGQLYKHGINRNSAKQDDAKVQHTISVYGDEFNEIANDDVTTVLNKGGGAGFQLTLFTQTWSDVEVKLGTYAKANQVGGNLNTLICMRVLDEVTAKYFTNKLSQHVEISSLTESSSVTDSPNLGGSGDFTSSNADHIEKREVPMLAANDLLQLPKGQAFFLIEGGQPFKGRMPLQKSRDKNLPQTIEKIAVSLCGRNKAEYLNNNVRGAL